MALLYYISGHGFGHARRCAETMRLLNERYPQLDVHVRTMAEPAIFTALRARVAQVPIDRGAVELDAMTIDWAATLGVARQLLEGRERFVAGEARYIREQGIRLIIADVPFLAGYVAEAAGVPCWAQGNFTWDWIYEIHTDDVALLEGIRGGYRRMTGQLRLPFPHPCDHFRRVVDVPFITSPLTMPVEAARRRLGIAPNERRPIVLVGMRGGTGQEILKRIAALGERYLFITPAGVVGAEPVETPLRFWDAMQCCDAVVSKAGHGIVTDCATLGVALLHPKRNGFREDPMIIEEGSRYFRERMISPEEYEAGAWGTHLDALLAQDKPAPAKNASGREFVAGFVAQELGL